ncbi:MAG: CHAP domain-containing protein [Lachnospiraceae bacterium]|nr:CHAP domain-containing protein [Lachnospiraceae bacterium]
MKSTQKRLFLFFIAAAIIATIVVPSGITTNASSIYKSRQIRVTKSARQVVDKFNGVKAYYRKGKNDGSNKFYSCAAYVKRYYKKVYGKNVSNLLYNRTPITSGDSFVRVSKPHVGDIVAMNTNHGTTHWAIAKKINANGSVTLIEQNWKWTQSSSTQCVVNRTVRSSSVRFYRLKSEANVKTTKVSLTVED